MARQPALIDDLTVARLLPPADLFSVIGRAFLDPLLAPQRLALESDEGEGQTRTLLAMPALRPRGLATLKVVTATRGRSARLTSHLLAFSSDGDLLAVIEAHQYTARRTAAVSVLAARALGAGHRRHLAVLGAGRQARAQMEAFRAFLPLEQITLWARRPSAAEQLSGEFADDSIKVRVASTPQEAVHNADIITCATASEAPLIFGSFVAPGAHVDLVGGFRPDMREGDDSLMTRARIVADSPAALTEAGDLLQPIANGTIDPARVTLLSALLAGAPTTGPGDITLFKSVGQAAQDLVIAEMLLARLGLLAAEDPARAEAHPPSAHGFAVHE